MSREFSVDKKTMRKLRNYKREVEYLASFYSERPDKLLKYLPVLLMTYHTAVQIIRGWGMSEYERGYRDAHNNIMV